MRKILKGLTIFVFFILLAALTPDCVNAADYNVTADGVWKIGTVSSGHTDAYSVTLKENGWLTLTARSYTASGRVELYNDDMSKCYYGTWLNGSNSVPAVGTGSYALRAGTYIVKMGNGNSKMKYKLKLEFRSSGVVINESEPNNTFAQAMKINTETDINGFISEDDWADFYKITLTKTTNLRTILQSESGNMNISIWDSNLARQCRDTAGNPGQSVTVENTFAPGDYYIRIDSSKGGGYTLKCIEWKYVTAVKLNKTTLVMDKNSNYSLLKSVSPYNANNQKLKWSSSDKAVATVSANGVVNALKAGTTTITAKTCDGGNVQSSCTIMVKPSKTQIKQYKLQGGRSVYMCLRTQSDVSGYEYQMSRSIDFKNKSVYTTSATYAQTAVLKKKKQYFFRVRSYVTVNGKKYYGEWSDVVSLVTQPAGKTDIYSKWKDI